MPSWTTMTDLSAGDLVTEEDMDAIRGNLEYVLDPNADVAMYIKGSNIAATNNTWQDVDATNLSLTITTYGGPVAIWFAAMARVGSGNVCYFDVTVDGTRFANTTKGLVTSHVATAPTTTPELVSFFIVDDDLAAGSHTFILQWCGSTTNGQNLVSSSSENPVVFGAMEL